MLLGFKHLLNLYIIPIKGQYEQECNAESLKKLGCSVGKITDISAFIEGGKEVKIEWEDSSDLIVERILG